MAFQAASDVRWRYAAVALVVVGLFLRVYHFVSDPSLWFDETALVLNVLEKNYAELLGPLNYGANGPVLFLWLERLLVTALGEGPAVCRAPALVASCLGLFAFFLVARRALPPAGAAWAVGLFALSDRILWHTVEVKPYTIDVLAAVTVAAVWLWTESWPVAGRLLLFAGLGPVLLLASYPAAFALCGPALVLLRDARRARGAGPLLAYALFVGALTATGLWLLQGPIRAQQETLQAIGYTWSEQMPDWKRPEKACAWPAMAVFEVLRYCFRPTGGFLIGFLAVGTVWVLRTGRGRFAAVLLAPLGAAMAAACLHRYPCGHGRPMLFFTPAAALLIGAGVPVVLGWCGRFAASSPERPSRRWSALAVAVGSVVLVLSPMIVSLYRVAVPWPRLPCRETAAHVLANRRPDDAVGICTWDQIYFYRQLDPSLRCELNGPTDPAVSRFWLTVISGPSGEQHIANLSQSGWAVVERRDFGELIVVLFARSGSAP